MMPAIQTSGLRWARVSRRTLSAPISQRRFDTRRAPERPAYLLSPRDSDAAAVSDPTPNVAILGWGHTARTRGWGRSGRSVVRTGAGVAVGAYGLAWTVSSSWVSSGS